ncbi:MAG: glycosyltransferase [Oscillospiraceae bacterium]|nr:glycosyltransferase [Oscillospiraceae bacterium]
MIEFLYSLQLKFEKDFFVKLTYVISNYILNILCFIKYRLFYYLIKTQGVVIDQSTPCVIVSLTTFPARIKIVSVCIETIMRQTVKPNRIILWLAQEQFSEKDKLPKHLCHLQKRGLEIKYCDNLRSHKKYYYAMKENPDDIIITMDDDVYYPNYTIERLVKAHNKHSNCICSNIAKYFSWGINNIKPYNEWMAVKRKEELKSEEIIPIGVGGVLYPPNTLSPIVFNRKEILNLCLHTDDLWLKTMSYINDTEIVFTGKFPTLICIGNSQQESLAKINCGENRNDIEWKNILYKYYNYKPKK